MTLVETQRLTDSEELAGKVCKKIRIHDKKQRYGYYDVDAALDLIVARVNERTNTRGFPELVEVNLRFCLEADITRNGVTKILPARRLVRVEDFHKRFGTLFKQRPSWVNCCRYVSNESHNIIALEWGRDSGSPYTFVVPSYSPHERQRLIVLEG